MIHKTRIIIKDDLAGLSTAATHIFTMTARDSVAENGRFVAAISGGSTPRPMHRMLTETSISSEIPWAKTHIFWVDERCVPENDPASNYGSAKKDFLDHVPIPPKQIHRMPGAIPPEEGERRYQKELIDFFQVKQGEFPVFDLIFLGIGVDGHTASLFPGHHALNEKERLVMAVKGGSPDVNRLTMTYPVLNHAGHVIFLVSGKDKATTMRSLFEDGHALFPAQRIQPLSGALTWLLDREAASSLPDRLTQASQ